MTITFKESYVEQYAYSVQFNKIECISKTNEGSAHDEVYFEVRTYSNPSNPDEFERKYYYHDSPLEMNPSNEDGHRNVDIVVPASGLHKIEFQLWERDKSDMSKGKDDDLGTMTITRDTAKVTTSDICNEIDQPSHDKYGKYNIYWRVMNKPLPSLRVLGIYCEKQSCGCNKEVIDTVADYTSQAEAAAAEVLGEIKTPKAQLMSDAFNAASYVIKFEAALIEWLAKIIEGDDDVYIQHLDDVQSDPTGGAFWPESGSNIKMTDEDQFAFVESESYYYRFPLDRGPVTIKIRDRDPIKKDIDLGALTIDESQYNTLKDLGAQVVVLSGMGDTKAGEQGAIYYLCYSVGEEDYAKAPTPEAQGYATA
ncbi:hypothetical protein [Photobacterium sp. 2_MG-2023]|uniref:hypothetical protein n=1 Tax=Photobacterium sp. 2_MG-2023 TaxID=3062663 RepID=UPI0026E34C2C|nr:hypothetical protein [Photobacterium sp. 2_MG-2023]